VSDEIDDVIVDMTLGGTGDADGLIERNVDLFLLGSDEFAVDADLVALGDSSAQYGRLTIAGDPARFDPLVRLSPRTDAGLADVLVESHRDGT
jgi:hypothetical protein